MEQFGSLLPLLLIFGAFYFLIIRPQRNRQQQQRRMVESVSRADRVVTIGGIHGTVVSVDGDTVQLELAPGTVVTLAKGAIGKQLVDADQGDTGESGAGPSVGPSLDKG